LKAEGVVLGACSFRFLPRGFAQRFTNTRCGKSIIGPHTRKTVRSAFASLNDFLTVWREADRKQTVVEELAAKGVPLDELAEQVCGDFDPFDLGCHIAFDQPPFTRRERGERVKKAPSSRNKESKLPAVSTATVNGQWNRAAAPVPLALS
jgi:type I site-specific restriction endonuclease